MAAKVLSVVIPAYNEEANIGLLLERIRAVPYEQVGTRAQIIVVDDGSADRTAAVAQAVPDVSVERLTPNRGKGAAVRHGLAATRGDYVVIQDADLEYDPADHLGMLRRLQKDDVDAVYGSRYLGAGRAGLRGWLGSRWPGQSWAAYLGGRSLSLVAFLCTGRYLTDTVTALKLFRRECICSLFLETSGFELDHEITSKLLASGGRIAEVPVGYVPRSRAEGKKIGARDWLIAVRCYARYRAR